jgi:hypothetical protein
MSKHPALSSFMPLPTKHFACQGVDALVMGIARIDAFGIHKAGNDKPENYQQCQVHTKPKLAVFHGIPAFPKMALPWGRGGGKPRRLPYCGILC